MNDNLFYLEEDIIKIYAQKRKALNEEDVKDLLKCLKGYLSQRLLSDDTYAVDLESVGILHKTFNKQDLKMNPTTKKEKLNNNMVIEDALLKNPLVNRKKDINEED